MSAIPSDPFRSLARWIRFAYNADFGRCFNYDYNGKRRWVSDPLWHNPGTASGRKLIFFFYFLMHGITFFLFLKFVNLPICNVLNWVNYEFPESEACLVIM